MLAKSVYFVCLLLCVECVTSLDNGESNGDILEKLVEDFKGLCPFTNLCFSRARENITVIDDVAPCCNSCSCNESCGTECCPDKPERLLNESEVLKLKNVQEQCVYAQIRSFNINKLNGQPYYMIGHCPEDYSDENVKSKCSREYRDFNLESENIKTIMPVSSTRMNVTFKNYFCALCHNDINTKLQFWNTKAICRHNKKLLLSNMTEIPLKLAEESWCQVVFEPSSSTPWYTVKSCSGIIERCNVTGNWIQYSYVLESACLSYTSEYRGFKNIHCFLCNGLIKDDQNVCQREHKHESGNTFVALLNFNNLEGSSSQSKETSCPNDSKFDPLKNECRSLICPAGMVLSKDRCSSLYPDTVMLDKSVVFSLHFHLHPTHIAVRGDSEHLLSLVDSVLDQISHKINMIHTAKDTEICSFNAYLKLEHNLEDTIKSMDRNNSTDLMQYVSYLSFEVNFSIEGIRNFTAVIEEMAMLYTSNGYYAQYSIQYHSDDVNMPEVYSHNLSEEHVNISDQFKDLSELFRGGQNDLEDGLGILWIVEKLTQKQNCESVLSIQPNPFCPRIKLNSNEFGIDIFNRQITIIESNSASKLSSSSLTFSWMIITKNKEDVLVCADEYFSQLPSESSNSNINFELSVLTSICLVCSITSLLISFFIYSVLPTLRTLPGLNNMALMFHLLLLHVLLLITNEKDIQHQGLCSAVGICIHYTLLASFFWMFICTFHMMKVFIKISERPHPAHTLKKFVYYFIFAETLSITLVISHMVVNIALRYDPVGFGYGGASCYIRNSRMIMYFVAVPLFLMLFANLGMFSYVIWSVSRLPEMTKHCNNERNTLLIFAKLSTLTGLAWIFGLLYEFTNSLIFAFAYIIFNAGQGVFIMFSFIINRRVHGLLYLKWHKTPNTVRKSTNLEAVNSAVSLNGTSFTNNTTDENIETKF